MRKETDIMANDSLNDFLASGDFGGEREFTSEEDFYRLYLKELESVPPCSHEEEERLLNQILAGSEAAVKRLVEGKLGRAVKMAEEYKDQGLTMSDLVQEANIALLLTASEYRGGDFDVQAEERIRRMIEDAIHLQKTEYKVEEELVARVNVLKDISAVMAEELGREATVEELAGRMKMTTQEIKGIMKLTLDAMSVSGEQG